MRGGAQVWLCYGYAAARGVGASGGGKRQTGRPATGGARGERGSCGRSPPQMPLLPLRRGTSSYVGSRFAFPPEVPFAPSTTLVDIATRARKSPPIRSQTCVCIRA